MCVCFVAEVQSSQMQIVIYFLDLDGHHLIYVHVRDAKCFFLWEHVGNRWVHIRPVPETLIRDDSFLHKATLCSYWPDQKQCKVSPCTFGHCYEEVYEWNLKLLARFSTRKQFPAGLHTQAGPNQPLELQWFCKFCSHLNPDSSSSCKMCAELRT